MRKISEMVVKVHYHLAWWKASNSFKSVAGEPLGSGQCKADRGLKN